MRKTLVYVAILAIMAFAIWYFLFSGGSSPYSSKEAGFTIKDTGAIGKIYLANNDGSDITVERTDSGWIVDHKYPVLRSTLDQLMTTFTKQEALYPVTAAAYDNVIKDMAASNIKVEIYDRAGKKMRVFYVGGSAVNNSGTNMMMDGAKTPYVVQSQSFVGYLTPQYATHLRDWRDRTVFNIPASEIKTVSVEYADVPANSFTITQDKGDVAVTADKAVMSSADGLNKKRANIYLHFFTNINCEGYINGLPDNDTTFKTSPKQSAIDITGIHGQHQHVDIYWMALNRRSKNLTHTDNNSILDVPQDYDADRLYAVMNNYKDTIIIQQFVFRNIFRKAKEFYTKDAVPAKQ